MDFWFIAVYLEVEMSKSKCAYWVVKKERKRPGSGLRVSDRADDMSLHPRTRETGKSMTQIWLKHSGRILDRFQ